MRRLSRSNEQLGLATVFSGTPQAADHLLALAKDIVRRHGNPWACTPME